MKLIIEVMPGHFYRVWQEGATGTRGPLSERMEAREYFSKREVLEAIETMLPEGNPETEEKIRKAQQELFNLPWKK
ncbi:MAG: hypothetical protein PHF44_02495 [Candidatus Pacebacteria bacterium]|nr:hypothetical protein [Candidatus Paceibacterota bacterium]